MARTTINTQVIPDGTIVSADLSYPLTGFSSTGIDDNATGTALTIDSSGNIAVTGTVDGRDVAADGTKLDGIEASADVTDTTNVTAAGALMDSEVTNLSEIKAFSASDYATAAQGTKADSALQNVVEDTSPQLGGNLDFNGNLATTFTSTGIDDNATSTAVTIDSSQNTTFAGTITSSDITISEGTPLLRIQDTDGTNQYTQLTNGNGNTYFGSRADTADGTILIGGYGGGSFTEFARWSAAGHLTQKNNLIVQGAFTSLGIDDNATSTAITIASDEAVTFANNIDLPDNGKAIFGASSDLQIYHDGSHSYIDEQGTGRLYINSGNGVWFGNADGSEIPAKINVDGACEFRYDNAVKLVTTSTGIDVTGTAVTDGLTVAGNLSVDGGTIKRYCLFL